MTAQDEVEEGDYVWIKARVVEVYSADLGLDVELFSKTDQYLARIRWDLVREKADIPLPPEPERAHSVILDHSGDVWMWIGSGWFCPNAGHKPYTWHDLCTTFGPVRIFEETT